MRFLIKVEGKTKHDKIHWLKGGSREKLRKVAEKQKICIEMQKRIGLTK